PQALFTVVKILVSPVELVEAPGNLFLLLGDPPLDVLHLLLPGAALRLELGVADLGLGLAGLGLGIARRLIDLRLGLLDDASRAGFGVADGANGGDLL